MATWRNARWILLGIFGFILLSFGSAKALTVLYPNGGGTGTTTTPSLGSVLIGNSNGTYTVSPTSSLGAGGGSGVSGVSAGYVSMATSATALTDSNIFQSGLNIGIGTTTPRVPLVVNGSTTLKNFVNIGGVDSAMGVVGGYNLRILGDGDTSGIALGSYQANVSMIRYEGAGGYLTIPSSGLTFLTNNYGAFIGLWNATGLRIGDNSNARALLDVASATITAISFADATGTNIKATGVASFGTVGIGTTTPLDVLVVSSTINTNAPINLLKMALSSPRNGAVWNDSTQNILALNNGNTQYISSNIYTATADKAINSTASTTAFSTTNIGTTTIASSSLKVGKRFTIRGAGYYSTPIGNVSTVSIFTIIGTTTVSSVTTGAFPASATNLPFDLTFSCTVRSVGVSGTVVCDGDFNYETALSGVAKTSNSISTVGTAIINTNINNNIDIQALWSAVTTQTATVQELSIDFSN